MASGFGAQDLVVITDLDLVAVITHDTTSADGPRVPLKMLLHDVLLAAVDGEQPPFAPAASCADKTMQLREIAADGSSTGTPVPGWPADLVPWTVSPPGDRLVLSRRVAGLSALWTIERDGSGLRQITTTGLPPVTPAWSPDGTHVAFARGEPPGTALWLVAPDGSDEHQLTSPQGFDHSPSWSPDGRQLAFVRGQGDVTGFGNPGAIWVIDTDGTGAHMVVAADATNPAWSPDGTVIAYEQSGEPSHIMLVDPVTRHHAELGEGLLPRWSPDSTRLVFLRQRPDGATDLYTMGRDGTHLRQLTDDPALDTAPLWPTTNTILYSTTAAS